MAATFVQLTANQTGALALFLADAPEERLAAAVDTALRPPATALPVGGVRHGWLHAGPDGGEAIDEILLVKPAAGQRLIMGHGGAAVRDAVAGFLAARGFSARAEPDDADPAFGRHALLAPCRTETQAAVLLAALDAGRDVSPRDIHHLVRPRPLALAGPPNAGKSTLLNALAGYDRAFTHPEPGATRDAVEATVDLAGHTVTVIDLPGYDAAADDLDRQAWDKAAGRLAGAELTLVVLDASVPWCDADAAACAAVGRELPDDAAALVVLNKIDREVVKGRAADGDAWRGIFPRAGTLSLAAARADEARAAVEAALFRAWGGPELPGQAPGV